jgi:hypothetical protein
MFTNDELKTILRALDITTRTEGLNAAATLLPIAQKVQKQIEDATKE